MLHWLSLAVLVAGLLSVGPAGIRAQDSSVVCLSSFGWMTNSRSQNPCVVAAYLCAACTGSQYTVGPLSVGENYVGPSADDADMCQCSTVTYNMVSACSLCQNGSTISWASWSFNCPTVYPEIFPKGIPVGTALPHWAYQNVTTTPNGIFNVTLADSVGDNPESTATDAQSTVSVVSTSTSLIPISTLTLPSTVPSISPTGPSSSNTNVGAIAGGVVGGVVGVALIAVVIVFFIVRKRRSRIPPSGSARVSLYSPQTTQHKVYDPSDPSTFPVSGPPPTTIIGSTTNGATSFVTYSSNDIPSLRASTGKAYTGVPEV